MSNRQSQKADDPGVDPGEGAYGRMRRAVKLLRLGTVGVAALLLSILVGAQILQLHNLYQRDIGSLDPHFDKIHEVLLAEMRPVENAVRRAALLAETYLRSGYTATPPAALELAREHRPGRYTDITAIRQTDGERLGNVVMLEGDTPVSSASLSLLRDTNLALALLEPQNADLLLLPNVRRSYLLSRDGRVMSSVPIVPAATFARSVPDGSIIAARNEAYAPFRSLLERPREYARAALWTPPRHDPIRDGQVISAAAPVFHRGTLVAAVGTDVDTSLLANVLSRGAKGLPYSKRPPGRQHPFRA